MRAFIIFLFDLLLVLMAAFAALLLRDNFETSPERLFTIAPYFAATALAAIVVIPLAGLNRAIWRFSTMPDYLRVIGGTLAIVIAAVAITFAFNRLDGVARSLPILQTLVTLSFLIGARVLFRLHHNARQSRKATIAPLQVIAEQPDQTILIVGLSRLTETYLQSIAEFAPKHIKVAGLLGRADRHIGRLVGNHKVLGRTEQVDSIVADLEVHGVAIDKIVVTKPFTALSEEARKALLDIEHTGSIELQFLAEHLGFAGAPNRASKPTVSTGDEKKTQLSFEIAPSDLAAIGRRRYWAFKRSMDAVIAAILLVALAPVVLVVSILVAVEIGLPVAFWQQRPGLGGRPFRLYKLRTMAAARGPDGYKLSDEERTSRLGNFLRRTRLDELPQLINILRGDMSFVGPRPLLPRDQADAYRARLLVRPGLTGWAQVVGGRIISNEDKAVLDVWYVQNASLKLDIEILLRTVPMVLFGDQTYKALIDRAWRDLNATGILKGDLKHAADEHIRPAA